MESTQSNGIVELVSRSSFAETLQKLTQLLTQKGVTIFAVIDHSGEAAKVGIEMRPTKLVIFGNPKDGTPVMLASPSAAIDLPLKILIAENEAGKALVSYNTPEYLAQRHGIPPDLAEKLAAVKLIAEKIVS